MVMRREVSAFGEEAFSLFGDIAPGPERRKSCETIQNDPHIALFDGCLVRVVLLVQALV
jgi:hypothetical protein